MPKNTRHTRKYPKYPEIPESKKDTRKYPIANFDTPTRPATRYFPDTQPDPILKNPTRWALVICFSIHPPQRMPLSTMSTCKDHLIMNVFTLCKVGV